MRNPLYRNLIASLLLLTGCNRPDNTPGAQAVAARNHAMDAFAEKIHKELGLKLLLQDDITDKHTASYCMLLFSRQALTLSEARILGARVIRDFLHMLQTDPGMSKYIEYGKNRQWKWKDYTPKPSTLGLKIDFWDEEIDRRKPPYIAEIYYADGSFSYFEADPVTQVLRLVLKETYEEAMKNFNRYKEPS